MALNENQIIEVMLQNRIRLTGFVCSIVADFHSAEDIYQKVCLQALQSPQKFNDTNHVLKWAWLACRSESLKAIRKRKHQEIIFDEHILDMIQTESQKTSLMDDPEIFSILQKCLSRLPSAVQQLLQKRYISNLSGEQIAAVLNRSVNSVYMAFNRAHRALYDCMRKQIDITEFK
jgi:RNA polymerase sigma-70 factor (ECF subfamily)